MSFFDPTREELIDRLAPEVKERLLQCMRRYLGSKLTDHMITRIEEELNGILYDTGLHVKVLSDRKQCPCCGSILDFGSSTLNLHFDVNRRFSWNK